MKDLSSVETLVIPADVTVQVKARKVTVTGPRGTITKNAGHIAMDIQVVSGDRSPRRNLDMQRETARLVESREGQGEAGIAVQREGQPREGETGDD